MWVEGGDIHDELLDQLGGVLAPPEELALTPSAAEFEALAVAVAARWPEGAVAPGDDALPNSSHDSPEPAVSPIRRLRSGSARPLRRLGSSAWRAGSVAAGLVVFSASAAAAANGGVPLPRPVRVVAYNVGFPVDSPALDDTHQHIEELKDAVEANDKPKAEATARRLQNDLTKVPANEKKQAEKKVDAVMVQAAPLIQTPVPTTTTTAPAPSSTTATAGPSSTTVTTTEDVEQKERRSRRRRPPRRRRTRGRRPPPRRSRRRRPRRRRPTRHHPTARPRRRPPRRKTRRRPPAPRRPPVRRPTRRRQRRAARRRRLCHRPTRRRFPRQRRSRPSRGARPLWPPPAAFLTSAPERLERRFGAPALRAAAPEFAVVLHFGPRNALLVTNGSAAPNP